jgi:malyl-CoA/(S)-citramalyl-CoA lyase
MKTPRVFFKPLAIGAPEPYRELPARVERMIHFVPPHLDKVRATVPEIAPTVDVILANLEDAIPADAKGAALAGLVAMSREVDFKALGVGFWTRINCLNSPWHLDDINALVEGVGDKLDVIMVPKVEGAWDIHYVDRLLAQLEARAGLSRPILIHAILETAQGVGAPIARGLKNPRGVFMARASLVLFLFRSCEMMGAARARGQD